MRLQWAVDSYSNQPASRIGLPAWSASRAKRYGSCVPETDFTNPMSEAVMLPPFAVTSVRKFVAVTACPDCDFTWPISVALTEPLPVVSPTRRLIATGTFPESVPSLTPFRRTRASKETISLSTSTR